MKTMKTNKVLQRSVSAENQKWIYNNVRLNDVIGNDNPMKIKCLSIRNSGIELKFVDKHNNRMLQNYEVSKFAIANFSELKLKDKPMSVTSDYIERFLKEGVTINGSTYRFFGCSNSQLKDKTCYLYAETFPKIIRMINSMGDFTKMNSVAKKMKRIGLLFTTTDVGIELKPNEYEDIDDIESENGDIFTDGCGFISAKFATFLAKQMKITFRNKKYIPSVFQIRYKGYKGVVMQNNELKGQFKVQLRKSMKKFSGCEDNSFSAKNHSMPYTFGKLNAELITLLSALGIKDEIFVKKQKKYFDFMRSVTIDAKAAFKFCCYKNEIQLAEQIVNDGLSVPEMKEQLKKLQSAEQIVNDGLSITRMEEQLKKLQSDEFKLVTKTCDDEKKKKIRILIWDSRLLFGVCDPTGKLKEGEVFVRITTSGNAKKTIEGAEIIASRNPCLHPGDIQKFKAVDVPELRYLYDVIVFPVVGARPAASLLSGGDLDGDRFFVCWDKELIPETLFQPYGYPPAKLSVQNDITHTKLIEYFVRCNNSSLGKIMNLYSDWCRVSRDGAASSECQELNVLFSSAVDAEKVKIPERLLAPSSDPNRSFVVDILRENLKREASSRIQRDQKFIPLNPEENLEVLLTSDVDILSEFDVFKLVHDICSRKNLDINDYLNFDFDAFSDVEKLWAEQMLKLVDDEKVLVYNSLSQSYILDSNELKNHPLHTSNKKIIRWKRFYCSQDDDWRRFGESFTSCMREFKRKLIVFKVNDLIKIAIYIPITMDYLFEETHVVDDAIKVFSFTHTENGITVTNTVKDYKLEFNKQIFQLYHKEKQNNTFVFFKIEKQGVKMSIATQKINRDVQNHVGRIRADSCESVEIYVISHHDQVGHQLLDISMNEVKTTEIRPCVENIPKEFEAPKLRDVEFESDIYKMILIERKFPLLNGLPLEDLNKIFEICCETDSRWELIMVIDHILENSNKIKSFKEVLQVLLDLITRLPYVAIEVSKYVGKGPTEHLTCKEYVKLLKGLINCCNELPSLCSNLIELILTILNDNSIKFSWEDLVELVQAIIFGVRKKEIAIEHLNSFLKTFKSLFPEDDQNCVEYFSKFVTAVCIDYLAEVDDQTEIDSNSIPICKGKEVLIKNITPTEDSGIYSAEIRLDCQYKAKNNDHVRFVCASPNEKPIAKPTAFDAIVQNVKRGNFTFKIQQEEPHILLIASWNLIQCSTTTTLMAMLDAILKLMKDKQNSSSEFNRIVANINDNNPKDLISNSPINFHSQRLNESQKDAIAKALGNSFTLVWGPPGTGKTTVVVETILQLNEAFEEEQILICASTHNAVDNILEKFLKEVEFDEKKFKKNHVIRVATEVSKVKSSLQNWTVDAFVGQNTQDNFKAKKEAKRRVKEAKFIFTTCTGAGLGFLREENFPIVIVDEASQLTEPNCLVPIVKRTKKIMMVGDHVQLRPTVTMDAQEHGLQLSLFERLYGNSSSGVAKTMLNVQYRMNPLLAQIASEMSYAGKLQSGVSENERQPPASNFPWPEIEGKSFPAVFVECAAEECLFSKSKSNEGQAKVVLDVVRRLKTSEGKFSIAVLSPYSKQVGLIKGKLGSKCFSGVEVNTIDGFQGREADVVIVSTVRKNDNHVLGFSDDERRINVALTRAKVGLVVIGNRMTLESSQVWKDYLKLLRKVDLK